MCSDACGAKHESTLTRQSRVMRNSMHVMWFKLVWILVSHVVYYRGRDVGNI